jgi:hypothetical protein
MRKNNNRRGGRSHRNGHHEYRHEVHDADVQDSLNQVGLSVFRSLGGISLDECTRVFNEHTCSASTLKRGEHGQHGKALNLVSLIEVKARDFDGAISTQEVIDEIYDTIPSLRKPLKIGIQKVGIFGGKDSKLRPFGVAIHEDERHKVRDERDAIIDILNEYSMGQLTREDWSLNNVPHISVGRVSMASITEQQHRDMIRGMNEVLPEAVLLDRATLYNPSK